VTAPLRSAQEITAGYGMLDILHGVSLTVAPREADGGDRARAHDGAALLADPEVKRLYLGG
jgi:hypothetical protein